MLDNRQVHASLTMPTVGARRRKTAILMVLVMIDTTVGTSMFRPSAAAGAGHVLTGKTAVVSVPHTRSAACLAEYGQESSCRQDKRLPQAVGT